MGYTKEVYLKCDGDGPNVDGVSCLNEYTIGVSTVGDTRQRAREEGWACHSGGDYCPGCNTKDD